MKKILLSLMAMSFVCVMASTAQTVSGNVGGHDYVDLGLPSGTLWATCNVGATKPTEYGDLFAWGETSTKETFTFENYKFFKPKGYDIEEITKYNTKSRYVTVDNKTVLDSQDDAVVVNWCGSWRMPTEEEMQELVDGCEWKWADNYEGSGVAGQIGKSKHNDNTIFFPAAGYGVADGREYKDRYGRSFSSSLSSGYPFSACSLCFHSGDIRICYEIRSLGCSVRAVYPKK